MSLSRILFVLVIILAGCNQLPETEANRVAYKCESGRTIHVSYTSDGLAAMEYEGRMIQMTNAVSASGARYLGKGLEWWTKGTGPGSEGTLFRRKAGVTGKTMESCVEAGK